MKSYSQAGQDLLVRALLPTVGVGGSFIDVGCSHPEQWSNTRLLEECGWRGIMVDSDQNSIDLCRAQRQSRVVCCDARTCDWPVIIRENMPQWGEYPVLHFASVDVDEHTTLALANLIRGSRIRFAVMVTEHDFYQRGDRLREANRDLLMRHGYEIIAADVHSQGCCFEDWAVAPDLVDMRVADRFRSNGLEWQAILKRGGAL